MEEPLSDTENKEITRLIHFIREILSSTDEDGERVRRLAAIANTDNNDLLRRYVERAWRHSADDYETPRNLTIPSAWVNEVATDFVTQAMSHVFQGQNDRLNALADLLFQSVANPPRISRESFITGVQDIAPVYPGLYLAEMLAVSLDGILTDKDFAEQQALLAARLLPGVKDYNALLDRIEHRGYRLRDHVRLSFLADICFGIPLQATLWGEVLRPGEVDQTPSDPWTTALRLERKLNDPLYEPAVVTIKNQEVIEDLRAFMARYNAQLGLEPDAVRHEIPITSDPQELTSILTGQTTQFSERVFLRIARGLGREITSRETGWKATIDTRESEHFLSARLLRELEEIVHGTPGDEFRVRTGNVIPFDDEDIDPDDELAVDAYFADIEERLADVGIDPDEDYAAFNARQDQKYQAYMAQRYPR